MQRAIGHPSSAKFANPEAEPWISRLLAAWPADDRLVIHIRRSSTEPGSPFRPASRPMNSGEVVIVKPTNSAFIGTQLKEKPDSAGIRTLFICGVITNNSGQSRRRILRAVVQAAAVIGSAA